ncbi:MAG: phosphatidylserine decarboxylase [Ruminococcaceae bacterium]|jgi:phosphatidylserine decarboxylase|nr:phosphatidylserine decarboxylase [Oscillospiraceae bacterium]
MWREPCAPPEDGAVMRALYGGALRPLLPIISHKAVSDLGGRLLSARASEKLVPGFVKRNGIDMSQYPERAYASFNDFFTREIKPGLRPLPESETALMAPCDSRLSAYEIDDRLTFRIKSGSYSVSSLLKNRPLAEMFRGGWCLVFRLCVDDYHRYAYFDSGVQGETVRICGRYYTVQPVALRSRDYYKENTREYTILDTDHFGRCVHAEIGATFVGRIRNRHGAGHRFTRGEEKGLFEFGGSTVVLLLPRGVADVDPDVLENTSRGFETRVLLGETIGKSRR